MSARVLGRAHEPNGDAFYGRLGVRKFREARLAYQSGGAPPHSTSFVASLGIGNDSRTCHDTDGALKCAATKAVWKRD